MSDLVGNLEDRFSRVAAQMLQVATLLGLSILRQALDHDCHMSLVDKQNGFRKDRNTIDQVLSLTNLIETRQKKRLSTFCAFIDFQCH